MIQFEEDIFQIDRNHQPEIHVLFIVNFTDPQKPKEKTPRKPSSKRPSESPQTNYPPSQVPSGK